MSTRSCLSLSSFFISLFFFFSISRFRSLSGYMSYSTTFGTINTYLQVLFKHKSGKQFDSSAFTNGYISYFWRCTSTMVFTAYINSNLEQYVAQSSQLNNINCDGDNRWRNVKLPINSFGSRSGVVPANPSQLYSIAFAVDNANGATVEFALVQLTNSWEIDLRLRRQRPPAVPGRPIRRRHGA